MKKPIIGIIGRVFKNSTDSDIFQVLEQYRRAIINQGGNPIVILPPQDISYHELKNKDIPSLSSEEKEMFLEQLSLCDGILIPGGFRVYAYDDFVVEYTIKNDIPTLGICLGMQVMFHYKSNSAKWKDVGNLVDHQQKHLVKIDKNSKLYVILNTDKLEVNSLHRKTVFGTTEYNIVAYSEDNQIEAIEYPDATYNIGVQWHPEKLVFEDIYAQKLIKSFIDASCKYSDLKIKK